jgi:hypothetical protein
MDLVAYGQAATTFKASALVISPLLTAVRKPFDSAITVLPNEVNNHRPPSSRIVSYWTNGTVTIVDSKLSNCHGVHTPHKCRLVPGWTLTTIISISTTVYITRGIICDDNPTCSKASITGANPIFPCKCKCIYRPIVYDTDCPILLRDQVSQRAANTRVGRA